MLFQGTEGEIDGHYECTQFDWKIKNFLSLSGNVDSYYTSPEFHFLGATFCLIIHPYGEKISHSEGQIGLYLQSKNRWLEDVQLNVAVKIDDYVKNIFTLTNTFDKENNAWGCHKFLKRSSLLQRTQLLMPSGTLTIAVTMSKGDRQPLGKSIDNSVQTSEKQIVYQDANVQCQFPEKTGGEKILQDIIKMWQSGDIWDVIIEVKGVEFKAHRFILSARTPVLAAMFQHDTTEKESGVITIKDCEPNVFELFLNYIYTGTLQNLAAHQAITLYAVAEKYLVNDLKALCLQCIQDNLSIDIFCNAVILAVKHGETKLLDYAVSFAAKNVLKIIKSAQWQVFITEEPITANEILIKAHEQFNNSNYNPSE